MAKSELNDLFHSPLRSDDDSVSEPEPSVSEPSALEPSVSEPEPSGVDDSSPESSSVVNSESEPEPSKSKSRVMAGEVDATMDALVSGDVLVPAGVLVDVLADGLNEDVVLSTPSLVLVVDGAIVELTFERHSSSL